MILSWQRWRIPLPFTPILLNAFIAAMRVDYLFLMKQSVFSKGEAKWILNLLALNTTKDDAFLFFCCYFL
jgi:hypothetical protein